MIDSESARAAAYIAAGLCMGIGTLGPAIGLGLIGSKACESIGKNPESAPALRNAMLLALSFVEATAVYALLIAVLLLGKS
jgi:F-type H+-transporting ATPase subunit c